MKIEINKFVKKIIIISLILVIIIIAVGGVYWFFFKKPVDQFKDWMLYRNDEVGIQFKYPPSSYNMLYIGHYTKGSEGVSAGNKISVNFYKLNEEGEGNIEFEEDFVISFFTKDYSAAHDYDSVSERHGLEDYISDCLFPDPSYENLESLVDTNFPSLGFCKLLKIDKRMAIFRNTPVFDQHCIPALISRIELMESGNKKLYSGVSIDINLKNSNNEYWRKVEEICSNPVFTVNNPCCEEDVGSEIINQLKNRVYSWDLSKEDSSLLLPDYDQEIITDLFQILSTFKFVDENADWKTYKNKKYGFEVKYPKGWSFYETFFENSLGGDMTINFNSASIPQSEDCEFKRADFGNNPFVCSNNRFMLMTESGFTRDKHIKYFYGGSSKTKILDSRDIIISGNKFTKITTNFDIEYIIERNNLLIIFTGLGYGDFFDQKILSSLKFTE